MNIERWHRLLASLHAAPESDTFLKLQSAYRQKHRAYHTARHIDECLSLFDELKECAEHPAEVELALWFHDAIYRPMSKSNEEQSARWATDFAGQIGVSPAAISRIRALIMATCHIASPADGDARLLVDVDLAILGAEADRYEEFERDVRREYRWVPSFIYRSKRAAILQSFLDRPRIYHLELTHQRFEERARTNIVGAIRALR
jgi:predicted metal-dependent HD superfamily phosphohydrolase